jgi:hypothetical protein
MIGDNGGKDDTELEAKVLDEDDLDDDLDDDAMPDIGGDTIIDLTGELRFEDLVAGTSREGASEVAHRREVRRRLEEIAEQRNNDLLDDTFNFNLDDDL